MVKFDNEKLLEVIKNVYQLSHIKTCILDEDMNEILFYPTQYTPICKLIRSKKEGNETCILSDKSRFEEVKKSKKTMKYVCPHGLTEIFAPIIIDDVVVGVLVLGQSLLEDFKRDDILNKVRHLGIEDEIINEAISNSEKVSEKQLEASAFLAAICAGYATFANTINFVNDQTADKIKKYISDNIHEKITAEDLCEVFFISKMTLYNIFKKYFNNTVANYILDKKLSLAKKIMSENPSMQIAQISDKVGIEANYLAKVFKKKYGYSPKKYQKLKFEE